MNELERKTGTQYDRKGVTERIKRVVICILINDTREREREWE